jgi:hypothetical protein
MLLLGMAEYGSSWRRRDAFGCVSRCVTRAVETIALQICDALETKPRAHVALVAQCRLKDIGAKQVVLMGRMLVAPDKKGGSPKNNPRRHAGDAPSFCAHNTSA